jgi:hypothetical protein
MSPTRARLLGWAWFWFVLLVTFGVIYAHA